MIEKLLAEIRAGGALDVGVLAKRLETTPQMITTMLEHLQRLGHICPYQNCSARCGGCKLK